MEMIKKLDSRQLFRKDGVPYNGMTAFGLFECPVCRDKVELRVSRGKAQKACSYKCRHNTQNITHGHSKTKLYKVWTQMKMRCKTKPSYVKKNIQVCDEWLNFDNFEKWSIDNGYKEVKSSFKGDTLSIDRKDNNKGYEPSNCKWITYSENSSKDNYRKRMVIQHSLNGEFLREFNSLADARGTTGVNDSGISAVCRGKRNHAGGFYWRYAA